MDSACNLKFHVHVHFGTAVTAQCTLHVLLSSTNYTFTMISICKTVIFGKFIMFISSISNV